jgi:hypothetical protein
MYGSRYSTSGGHYHKSLEDAVGRIKRKRAGGEVYELVHHAPRNSARINSDWILVARHSGREETEVEYLP